MRVVVTGAAGFIGSHVTERLLADGHEVVGIDCFTDYYDPSEKRRNISEALAHPRFTLSEADLRTDALEPILEGADAVVNEAATPGLVLSWDDFERYLGCNVSAVKRLADASIATGIRHFVQASTSSVYGAQATGPESSETLPVSPYGVTKLAAEHLLRAHSETYDLPLTILRYFSIYGPRQRPDMAYRIFCDRLRNGEAITIYGDGSQSRSNTYITDCVAATTAVLERAPDGSIFNIGGGEELALLDAVSLIAEALDVEPVVEFREARRGDQRRTVADTSKARRELRWEPRVSPRDGLALQAAWCPEPAALTR